MQIGDSQSNDKKKQVKRNIEPAIKIAKFNSFNPLLNILIALICKQFVTEQNKKMYFQLTTN